MTDKKDESKTTSKSSTSLALEKPAAAGSKPEVAKPATTSSAPEAAKPAPATTPAPANTATAADKAAESKAKVAEAAKAPESKATAAAPAPAPVKSGGGSGLAAVAVLLALGAGAGSGYLWYLQQQEKSEQALAQAQLQSKLDQALGQLSQARAGDMGTLKEQLGSQSQTAQGLQAAIKGLQSDLQSLKEIVATRDGNAQLVQSALTNLEQGLKRQTDELAKLTQKQQSDLTTFNTQFDQYKVAQRGLIETMEAVKIAASKGGDINALPLTEVEYLLRLADHKLRLQNDVSAAVTALSIADQRLGQVNEPVFEQVRKLIGDNVATLKGVEVTDFSKLAHSVFELETLIKDLPVRAEAELDALKQQVRPRLAEAGEAAAKNLNTEDPSWLEQFGSNAWKELKDIVVIGRDRSDTIPIMGVEQQFFLRQALKMEMEAMRLALLAKDTQAFQDANAHARQMLSDNFNLDDANVARLLRDLATLQQVKFSNYVPELAETLRAFQAAMLQRQPVRSSQITQGAQ